MGVLVKRAPFEPRDWRNRRDLDGASVRPGVRIPHWNGETEFSPDELLKWGGVLSREDMRFLRYIARGYQSEDAAKLCDMDPDIGPAMERALLGKLPGLAYVRALQQQMVAGRMMGLALTTCEQLMTSAEDDRVRLGAARTIMEAGAFFGGRAEDRDASLRAIGADPTALSASDLAAQAQATREEIARLDEMLAQARSVVIEGEAEEGEAEPASPPEEAPWD